MYSELADIILADNIDRTPRNVKTLEKLTLSKPEMSKERINLSAFKDGVANGLLEGNRAIQHPDMYSYNQGYDFGLTLYNRLMDK